MAISTNGGAPLPSERLILWHFFEALEQELSYERDMEKYRQFRTALDDGTVVVDADFAGVRQFLKILYLQNHAHETAFDILLDTALALELADFEAMLNRSTHSDTPSVSTPEKPFLGTQNPDQRERQRQENRDRIDERPELHHENEVHEQHGQPERRKNLTEHFGL